MQIINRINTEPNDNLPHLRRWYRHISALKNDKGEKSVKEAAKMSPISTVTPVGSDQLPEEILKLVETHTSIDSLKVAELLVEDHQKVIGAVKSLESLGDV